MRIKATTNSGSIYEFYQKDGHTFFTKIGNGPLMSGRVVRICNGAISINKPIQMEFHRDGLYCKADTSVTYTSTTAVVNIEVLL